jgi:hypothetical protein
MELAEKTLKPVAGAPQKSAVAGHSAAVAGICNSPRVVAQRQPLRSLFGEALQLQVGLEHEAPVQAQAAVHLNGLQTAIDRSPRMLAQRRALDVALGGAIQREADGLEDEELLQARMGNGASQRMAEDEDDEALLQGRFKGTPVQRVDESAGSDDLSAAAPVAIATPVNDTGMPNQLKTGIESLSGMDMSDVRVHHNSDKPAQLNALAYAQGNEIHLGPGQEQHLPHEAWHVVQQRQRRVRETVRMAGVGVNDEVGLEREADEMGERANTGVVSQRNCDRKEERQAGIQDSSTRETATVQAVFGDEMSDDERWEEADDENMPAHEEVRDKDMSDEDVCDGGPDEGMSEEGHLGDEGDANLELVCPEDIPPVMMSTILSQLPYMPIFTSVRQFYGDGIARRTLELWCGRQGVTTRATFEGLVAQAVQEEMPSRIMQRQRKPGESGPSSYIGTWNGFPYSQVVYDRNSKGCFDFSRPLRRSAWSNPVEGHWCNLQNSCNTAGKGLMPSGGSIPLAKGSRSQHFAIANHLNMMSGSASPTNLTWHHLQRPYEVVLVDRMVHSKHGHNGGKLLWT